MKTRQESPLTDIALLTKVIIEKSRDGRIEIWAGFGPVGITEKKTKIKNIVTFPLKVA